MWYAQHRKKRILPVKVVDYFSGWDEDMTVMRLLSQEYDLRYTDQPNLVFCQQFGDAHKEYDCPKVFCAGEPWGLNGSSCDLLVTFEYEESDNAIRFPLYGYYFPDTSLCKRITHETALEILAKKTKFCNFVYSNGGPHERIEFMKRLSQYKPVDCSGSVMNNTGVHMPGKHSGPEKVAFLADYKFTIAFENCVKIGYTSEKICAPMVANSLPIYYGNPEVHRDFNPRSFVNVHDFSSFDEAISKVIELDKNDDLYAEMTMEPWLHGNVPSQYVDTCRLTSHLVRWIEERHLSLEPDTNF